MTDFFIFVSANGALKVFELTIHRIQLNTLISLLMVALTLLLILKVLSFQGSRVLQIEQTPENGINLELFFQQLKNESLLFRVFLMLACRQHQVSPLDTVMLMPNVQEDMTIYLRHSRATHSTEKRGHECTLRPMVAPAKLEMRKTRMLPSPNLTSCTLVPSFATLEMINTVRLETTKMVAGPLIQMMNAMLSLVGLMTMKLELIPPKPAFPTPFFFS